MCVLIEIPGGSAIKDIPANAGDARDMGSIPRSGRSSGEENGNPLQDSCLKNPMDSSPPDSSVHEILQARILEWVALPFFRGSS